MLPYQDPTMSIDPIYRNDLSIIRDTSYRHDKSDHRDEQLETSKSRTLFKKGAKFLFSHIGLVSLVAVYAIGGGFLFQLLEIHQEKLNCQEAYGEQMAKITKLKQKLVTYIQYNISQSTSALPSSVSLTLTYSTDKDNITVAYEKIAAMLYDYRDFVIASGAQYRYYGDNCSIINKWTYPNSLLFAITIITTIGYGSVTPETWEGQICCICYATIGIPIFFLCLAKLSEVLGDMFRFVYSKICCKPCHMICKRRDAMSKAKLEEESGISKDRVKNGGWSIYDDNNYYSSKQFSDGTMQSTNMNDDNSFVGQRENVPLTITMCVIALYIWVGSVMFHSFEDWTLSQAGYFCFITLATIGFGDFVPGQKTGDPNAVPKLFAGAIYVLLGMATLAMCFDLIQEEIMAKFRWLGRRFGICENDEDALVNQTFKAPKNQRNASPTSSITDSNQAVNTNRKTNDDEHEKGWPTQPDSNGTRKLSPRTTVSSSRVHPASSSSNEGTIHQRSAVTKMN